MIENDRTKLNENALTQVLLSWVAEKIDELALNIAKKESKERNQKRPKYLQL